MYITYISLQADKLIAKLASASDNQAIFSKELKYFEIFLDKQEQVSYEQNTNN